MYKPTKQAVWCTENLPGSVWNSGRLHYGELPNIFPSDVTGDYFANATEKCKILGSLMGKELENLEDHGCPKFRDLVDERRNVDLFRHETSLHCAERKANFFW